MLTTYYIRKLIDSQNDINNIKCNPVNLFLKSIHAEPSESIDEFAQCVQLLGPHQTILESKKEDEVPVPPPVNNANDAAKLFAQQDFGLPGFV